jgi:hypothetical protein
VERELHFTCICSRVSASGDNGFFTGVWRGKIDDVPGITMLISDEGGDLTGAVLFYLIRGDDGQHPRSIPGDPEPMFHMKLNGNSLDFQVSHVEHTRPGRFMIRQSPFIQS